MNAPDHPRYQVNQLTPDPRVKFDREFASHYLLYAHRLAARGYVQAAVGNMVMRAPTWTTLTVSATSNARGCRSRK